MKKFSKWLILAMMFFLCLVIIPFTLSKYSTTIGHTITLNARQPEYDVIFRRSGLPVGYQEVEYIESTRTQRIKTNYIPKTNTKVELDLSFNGTFVNSVEGGVNEIFSSYYTSNFDAFTINFGANVSQYNQLFPWFNKQYQHGGIIESFYITNEIRTNRNTLIVEPGHVSYGTVGRNITRKTKDQEEELYLFGRKDRPFTGYNLRVYRMVISEDGDIKGIYIPCYRMSDDERGLYDIVNDEFFTNIGTGTFNIGLTTQEFTYGTAQNLTANTYTRDGYTFAGWNTKADGTGTSYTDGQEVNNLTTENNGVVNLYAQWTAN